MTRTFVRLLALTVCCCWLSAAPASARPARVCGTQRPAARVVLPPRFIVTPFAVPIAVPVAPRSFVYYDVSYDQGLHSASPIAERGNPVVPEAADAAGLAGEARRVGAESAAARSSRPIASSPRPHSLVERNCLKCHGQASPAAGFTLSDARGLSAEQRLLAIRRLLDDDPARRMPKDSTLSAQELGELLQELSEVQPLSEQGEDP
ncbi:MAG: c-type cytochrome domain-containing protein [Pirellulales bacterium]